MRTWLIDKSTGDVLVILIAGTVCMMLLGGGLLIGVLLIAQPGREYTALIKTISDVVNTLIGLLAGFLAGRSDAMRKRHEGDVVS